MSYTQICIHYVWATYQRKRILVQPYRTQLFEHIKSNALSRNIRLDTINGYTDHIHCLVWLQPSQSVAKVAQLLKGESSLWFNKHFESLAGRLYWQENYFAASVSMSQVHSVRDYIDRQEEHHRKKTFAEEYDALMKTYLFVRTLENSLENYKINTRR